VKNFWNAVWWVVKELRNPVFRPAWKSHKSQQIVVKKGLLSGDCQKVLPTTFSKLHFCHKSLANRGVNALNSIRLTSFKDKLKFKIKRRQSK
jgi:hypothetical protein